MERAKIVETLAKGVALASAILYGLGFVVVNAYLSKFGTSDFTLTNPRFVFAGALCAMYLFFWWFFVGNYVLSVEKSLSKVEMPSISLSKKIVLTTNFMFTEVIFNICLATVAFSATTFEESNFLDPSSGLIVFPGLALLFIEQVVPSIIGTLYIAIKSIIQISLVAIFLILADTGQQYLAGSYFLLFIFFIVFYEHITKKVHDNKSVSAITYLATFLLGAVISFGYMMYGETKPQYGGGHPISVSVIAKESLPNDLVFQDVNNRFGALLIYSTDKWSVLQIPKRTLLLNQDQIKGLVFPERKESINPRTIFQERMKKKGITWFESPIEGVVHPPTPTSQ